MPLCEYFVADSTELESVAAQGSPTDGLTVVDAKGFDMIPIEALAKRLTVHRAVDEGEPIIHGNDFEWFAQRLTTPMLEALSGLAAGDLAAHAEALAQTPNLKWPADQLTKLLGALAEMARGAKASRKDLYMWVST